MSTTFISLCPSPMFSRSVTDPSTIHFQVKKLGPQYSGASSPLSPIQTVHSISLMCTLQKNMFSLYKFKSDHETPQLEILKGSLKFPELKSHQDQDLAPTTRSSFLGLSATEFLTKSPPLLCPSHFLEVFPPPECPSPYSVQLTPPYLDVYHLFVFQISSLILLFLKDWRTDWNVHISVS